MVAELGLDRGEDLAVGGLRGEDRVGERRDVLAVRAHVRIEHAAGAVGPLAAVSSLSARAIASNWVGSCLELGVGRLGVELGLAPGRVVLRDVAVLGAPPDRPSGENRMWRTLTASAGRSSVGLREVDLGGVALRARA